MSVNLKITAWVVIDADGIENALDILDDAFEGSVDTRVMLAEEMSDEQFNKDLGIGIDDSLSQ